MENLFRFLVYSPLRSKHFCMHLNQLSKHFGHFDWGISKACILNHFFRCRKTLTSHFFTFGNKKKPSQDYTADDSSTRCFECSKMQFFEPMSESSHCRGEDWSVFGDWFSWFLGRQLANKWLCTTQNWLFCVVLVVRLRPVVTVFPKKQAIICLEVLRAHVTFVGFG